MSKSWQKKGQKEEIHFAMPNANGSVWPKQGCPDFELRESVVAGKKECWYCRYADFHLGELKALEVGICCWPKKIMK